MKPYKDIYILDDDELGLMLNRQFLNFSLPSAKVTSFVDGLELIKNLVSNRIAEPDLLLLDFAMTGLSGWEFLDYCQKYKLEFDVMILSSSVHFEDIDKAKSYGQVKNYIVKPLNKKNIAHYIIERKQSLLGVD
ncbi:MAG: response regulator [Flavobacteriales bacterium]